MKKLFLLLSFFSALSIVAQVGIGTTNPNSSSALDITSTTKGFLLPRMTQNQRNAIVTPATGLLIYQTDNTAGYYFFNGVVWQPITVSGSWNLTGNSGTLSATNQLGTTDNQPLVFKTNSTEAFRILETGNVAIGSPSSTSKLLLKSVNSSYVQDFEAATTGNISTSTANNPYNFNSNIGCTTNDSWKIATTNGVGAGCTSCSGNRAIVSNGASSCEQNATLVVKLGVINATEIIVSFNYSFKFFDAPDSFTVTLYNETTSTDVMTLLALSSDSLNVLYSKLHDITSGDSYSLRFKYIGNDGYGATVDNVGYIVPNKVLRIEDGNQTNGYVLTSDANGNGTWKAPSSFGSPDDDWRFNSGSSNTDPIFRTGSVKIGSTGSPTALIDVYNGGDGNEIGLGSSEYIIDGGNQNWFSHSIVPRVNNTISLGSSSLRWSAIYATNGTINTSDLRDKEEVQEIKYGLKELRELHPVSYQWKEEKFGNIKLTDSEKKNKIGFIAQDLQKVLPEVVQDSEWRPKNENDLLIYELKKTNVLGVCYSEIIPVVVKATQEHQNTLDEIKKILDETSLLVKSQEKIR